MIDITIFNRFNIFFNENVLLSNEEAMLAFCKEAKVRGR